MADQPTDKQPKELLPKYTKQDLLEGKVPVKDVQMFGEKVLKEKDPYAEVKPDNAILEGVKKVAKFGKEIFTGAQISYNRADEIAKQVPDFVPEEYRDTVMQEAGKLGIKAENLAKLMRKENSLFDPRAVGQVDPTDIGLMQINKANFPMIREKFKAKGLEFNPYNPYHSIMGAAMVLEEHKKSELIDNEEDLITSYNTGPKNIFRAKQGDTKAIERVANYRKGIFD